MEEQQRDLRQLVMKRAADRTVAGSGMASPAPRGEPLIQQVGPDFSKLSRELNRVVLKIQHQSEVASDCQVHGEHYSESPRRGSRGQDREGSRPHSRGSVSNLEREGSRPQSRGSISASQYEGGGSTGGQQRSLSAETSSRGGVRAPEPSYQSLPRRLSRLPQESRGSSGRVDRRQSFQDFKTFRDKFTGKLDFKTTLRTCEKNPDELPKAERDWIKRNEQEKRREARARARGRQYSEPREYGPGDVIESDFDFRSPPSTRDTSREGRGGEEERYSREAPRRGEQVYTTPGGSRMARQQTSSPRYQYGYHDLKYGSRDELRSPSKVWSPSEEQLSPGPTGRHIDPLSPRRVEFSAANEVFSFNKSQVSGESVTPGTSRPPSRCESPAPKSILRHTASDPAHKSVSRSHTVELASPSPREQESNSSSGGRPAVRSNTTDLSFCSTPLTRPTSLIIPQAKEETSSKPTKGGQSLVQILLPKEEQAGGDSDDTLIEEKHEVEASEKGMVRSEETSRRRVPPLLADWNRSQSFPPNKTKAGSSQQEDSNLRKLSDQGLSNSSLLSQPLAECGLHHSDIDLLRGDNEAMRLRVGDLEKQVHDNNDDIKCLKATLSECLRRIDRVEQREESAPPAPAPRVRQRANVIEPSKPQRRPTSDYGGMGQRVQQQIHGSSGYSAHRTR